MKNAPNDRSNRNENDEGLTHIAIINDEGLSYGLPSPIFWGGICLSMVLTWILRWYIGLGFAAIYFTAMYAIHKDDPKALRGWIDAALRRRTETWTGGVTKSRSVYYIKNKD